jgi:hypothetical protein
MNRETDSIGSNRYDVADCRPTLFDDGVGDGVKKFVENPIQQLISLVKNALKDSKHNSLATSTRGGASGLLCVTTLNLAVLVQFHISDLGSGSKISTV